jgi:lysozyme
MSEIAIVTDMLKRHEGLFLKPYKDSRGYLTIGYGTCLDTRGITEHEAEVMLNDEIVDCVDALEREIPDIYSGLNEYRRAVLIDMAYNLGIAGLLTFHNTLAKVKAGAYEEAAAFMLQSKWAKQVGNRAVELSEIMRKGYA